MSTTRRACQQPDVHADWGINTCQAAWIEQRQLIEHFIRRAIMRMDLTDRQTDRQPDRQVYV